MPADTTTASTMSVLSVVFFMVAGVWLLAALFYSIIVLCFLRMRAQGRLGSIYDENFGRVQLIRGFYLPLGCIFRRYARHLQLDDERPNPRFFSRTERRAAMEALLLERKKTRGIFLQRPLKSQKRKKEDEGHAPPGSPAVVAEITKANAAEDSTDLESGGVAATLVDVTLDDDQLSEDGGPICSICLGDYESSDPVFCPKTCSHQFHESCILDWLQRQTNTECPCCRVAMVSEDEVWTTVKRLRKEKRKQQRRARQKPSKANAEEEPVSETEDDVEDDEEETAQVTR